MANEARSVEPRHGVGPVLEPFEDVRRIAVLRGGGLGDLMFAMPAVEALAAAYPEATITLLGSASHAALLSDRPGPVDEVDVLPVSEGVRPPRDGEVEDEAELERFFARMRQRRFGLAVQVHGGGRYSNPFLLRLGARHTVGTRTPDAAHLERVLPYHYYQNEFMRALEVVGLAGAAPVSVEATLHVTASERRFAEDLLGQLGADRPIVGIHPGATDPRRRWPAERFAEVVSSALAEGAAVVVVGDETDVPAADVIVAQAEHEAPGRLRSLAGKLDLGELCAVLEACAVVIGNDSGPRHLAQAVGTPTVGIYWLGNVINAGALGRSRHRVHMSWVTHCPVCGIDVTQVGWTAERCPHDESLVAGISAAAVYEDVAQLTATSPLPHDR
ncbi:glycosyltransferase family 9 protein [Aeromicrobium phragmitis]|uniref:Glycosyltransferase family 9 protein n=1 Tax=Aeromicrobium phragmitis TaxID=2478914 RepID=A0A3L8PJN7_9ACTN|nr:glycosyltransferase family 9 protein [Aeromicrobium phragmitis]RLV55491.1 glycosyltransferase family 9 protein [Aeromicrobium phragmitis]